MSELLLRPARPSAGDPGHEARIRLYADRAAAGRDIFTGKKWPTGPDRSRCAGCGRRPRKANHLAKAGWLAVPVAPPQYLHDRSVDLLCRRCRADGLTLSRDAA